MINRLRLRFFAIASLLNSLSSAEAIERLKQVWNSVKSPPAKTSQLKGYRLLLETMLFWQLEIIAEEPEVLRLQQGGGLRRWNRDRERSSATRFKTYMSENSSDSAFVAHHINELLLKLVRSGNCWPKFEDAISDLRTYTDSLLDLIDYCEAEPLRRDWCKPVPDTPDLVRMVGTETLYDIFHDCAFKWDDLWDYAHTDANERVGNRSPISHPVFELETSKDLIQTVPVNVRPVNENLASGIDTALEICLGFPSQSRPASPDGSSRWAVLLDETCQQFQPRNWPIVNFGLSTGNDFPVETVRNFKPYETDGASTSGKLLPKELLQIRLGDNASLATRSYSYDDPYFEALVRGRVGMLPKSERVEILKIVHHASSSEPNATEGPCPEIPDGNQWISLAVRVGRDWHIVHNVDCVGRRKSTVWGVLDELCDRVAIEKIGVVETSELLGLCDLNLQLVNNQLKAEKSRNARLRGCIPELLAGMLLTYQGFHPVKVNVKLANLGKLRDVEFDAVGYISTDDGGELNVVEVKRQSTYQQQLLQELEVFEKKMAAIRTDPSTVLGELGLNCPVKRIRGTFISMARFAPGDDESRADELLPDWRSITHNRVPELTEFIDQLDAIEFWNRDRFECELEKAGLPNLPVGLLDDAEYAWDYREPETVDAFMRSGYLSRAAELAASKGNHAESINCKD